MSAARPSTIRGGLTRAALAVLLALGLASTMLSTSDASSHREAPLIANDPVADNTDLYAFVSPDNARTTTIIANWIPLENPASGPNFFTFGDDVLYEINIDNDGDAIDDITFEFEFATTVRDPNSFLVATGPITSLDDPDHNVYQTYSVAVVRDGVREVLATDLYSPPNNIGPLSTPDYKTLRRQAIYDLPMGGKVFAGQRDEVFPADLGSIFDLGQLRPFLPAYQPAARDAELGSNATDGFNVHSIAIKVPSAYLTEGPDNPTIGVYSTTYRRAQRVFEGNFGATPVSSGEWVQVSRLGNPLVNEVVVPLSAKDAFNAIPPSADISVFPTLSAPPFSTEGPIPLVTDPILGGLIEEALYGIDIPDAPRNDLVSIFLTGIEGLNQTVFDETDQPAEYLRLNTSIPPSNVNPNRNNRLGLLGGEADGYPNGRRLLDDVVDISLRAVAGATPLTPEFDVFPNNALGDGVSGNDGRMLTSFPYIPDPHSGYEDRNGVRQR